MPSQRNTANSYLLHHEQCPKCAKQGKDVSHDNFGIFSDGHSYCFSCGFSIHPNSVERFKTKENPSSEGQVVEQHVTLPHDADVDYPPRALNWIQSYGLDRNDLLQANALWSTSLERLIFPIFAEGSVLGWQGRYFGEKGNAAKWFGRGNLKDTYHLLGDGNILVLTEDIISAIKVSKAGFMTMPLFGCVVGLERFRRLYNLFGLQTEVVVWLDPDKRTEASKEAHLGRTVGLLCRRVFSEQDPKEYTTQEIKEILK